MAEYVVSMGCGPNVVDKAGIELIVPARLGMETASRTGRERQSYEERLN